MSTNISHPQRHWNHPFLRILHT